MCSFATPLGYSIESCVDGRRDVKELLELSVRVLEELEV